MAAACVANLLSACGSAGGHTARGEEAVRPWRVLPDAPVVLVDHSAVWTGREVLLWGGGNESPHVGSRHYREAGMSYDPARGTWRRIPHAPIDGRGHHVAVWTGMEMVVWGGVGPGGDELKADGAVYTPTTRRWRRLPEGPLAPRVDPVAVWTGREALIWGGRPAITLSSMLDDGAAFDPRTAGPHVRGGQLRR